MEKKTSIFLIILLCILVAVAGGSVSYAYLNKAHNDEKQALEDQIDDLETQITKLHSESRVTPTPTASPATTSPSDPTAGWKTYTDDIAGITIKYPTSYGTATSTTSGDLAATTGTGSHVVNFSGNSLAHMSYSRAESLADTLGGGELLYIALTSPTCPTCTNITSTAGLQIKYNKVIMNETGRNGSYMVGYIPISKNNLHVFVVYWEKNGIGTIPAATETEFQNILKSAIITP